MHVDAYSNSHREKEKCNHSIKISAVTIQFVPGVGKQVRCMIRRMKMTIDRPFIYSIVVIVTNLETKDSKIIPMFIGHIQEPTFD